MKSEKCVAARFTKCCTTQDVPTDFKPLPTPCSLSFPLIYFEHTYVWVHWGSMCVCVYMCACVCVCKCATLSSVLSLYMCHIVRVYKQRLSPVTGHHVYSGFPSPCTPSQCPGSMWKSTGKGHQVTFHLPAGIVPQGYCVCVFRSGVCHKLHSVSVQSIAGRLHNADRYAHTHTPVMYEIEILPYTVVSCVIHFICLPLPRHAPAVVMHSV